jgi:hypothetical protein
MEQRVYSIICKYGPISSNVIARLYNVSGNKITNEIVNKAEPVNVELVENCVKKLLKNKKIVQGAPGEPKRYSSSNMFVKNEDKDEEDEFEEEYYYEEEFEEQSQLEQDNYFLATNDMKSQYAMSNVHDTHLV